MGKSFRGADRKKHKENYLKFKDKRNKRTIKDENDSQSRKREGEKENRYIDYYEDY